MSTVSAKFVQAPFDVLAEGYDQTFTFSKIGLVQRAAVWRELGRTFRPGDRVLEIGCGTGVDACFMGKRGVNVVACDNSPAMLEIAARRVRETCTTSVDLRLLPAENLSTLRPEAHFDGAFSNFAALNCVEDLKAVGQNLGRLLKPGGIALFCLLGPSCLWEIFWYLLKANPHKAFRRWHRAGVTARLSPDTRVHVLYYSVRSLSRIFAPSFQLLSWSGIGLMVPPSYVESAAKERPALLKMAERSDRVLTRCPLIRGLSDHVLLKFERVQP